MRGPVYRAADSTRWRGVSRETGCSRRVPPRSSGWESHDSVAQRGVVFHFNLTILWIVAYTYFMYRGRKSAAGDTSVRQKHKAWASSTRLLNPRPWVRIPPPVPVFHADILGSQVLYPAS